MKMAKQIVILVALIFAASFGLAGCTHEMERPGGTTIEMGEQNAPPSIETGTVGEVPKTAAPEILNCPDGVKVAKDQIALIENIQVKSEEELSSVRFSCNPYYLEKVGPKPAFIADPEKYKHDYSFSVTVESKSGEVGSCTIEATTVKNVSAKKTFKVEEEPFIMTLIDFGLKPGDLGAACKTDGLCNSPYICNTDKVCIPDFKNVHTLVEHDDLIWAGTDDGVFNIRPGAKYKAEDTKEWSMVSKGLGGDNAVHVLLSSGDRLLAGTRKGVFGFNKAGQSWAPKVDSSSLNPERINALLLDGEVLYAGADGGVIWTLDLSADQKSWVKMEIDTGTEKDLSNVLALAKVSDASQNKVLYVGTKNNLWSWGNISWKKEFSASVSELISRSGSVYAITGNGVFKLPFTGLINAPIISGKVYTADIGMPEKDSFGLFYVDEKGVGFHQLSPSKVIVSVGSKPSADASSILFYGLEKLIYVATEGDGVKMIPFATAN